MQIIPNIELAKLTPRELRDKFLETINNLEIQGFFTTAKAIEIAFKKEIKGGKIFMATNINFPKNKILIGGKHIKKFAMNIINLFLFWI